MSKTTYYYIIDSEGFYPKGTFEAAISFDSEHEAQDVARKYGARVLPLGFIKDSDHEWLDDESEAKVSLLEEGWNRSADIADADLDM